MAATSISKVKAREILDSRGNPTIEVEVTLADGSWGRAMVPSGASKGQREALELRDGDKKRFLGKGVLTAVRNVNETIAAAVTGKTWSDVMALDRAVLELDGTAQKSKLGANAMLGVSLAFANAVAVSQKRPLFLVMNEWMGLGKNDLKLPVPLMNILNGGEHANNGLEIQEFMIVPHGFDDFASALRAGCEVFHHLKEALHDRHFSVAVGDEGGFAPALAGNEDAVKFICEAVEKAGYRLNSQISLALDVAASSFYEEGKGYGLRFQGKEWISSESVMEFYAGLLGKYPIVSIEDGLDENDWAGWKALTQRFGNKTQLVGDDLFVTQTQWVKKGIEEKAANAVLVKVNQVGTLAETFDTMKMCREARFNTVTSHRSGETEDVTIAHLAVGSGCGQIKTGSSSRSERTAKYNELLRIEEWGRENGQKIAFARPWG